VSQILYKTGEGKISIEVDGNSPLDWIHLMETCIHEAARLIEKAPEDLHHDQVMSWMDDLIAMADDFAEWRNSPGEDWPEWFTRSTS
jgi:hypothetical protein